MGPYQVGIAGAGVAGLALAAFLARAGHRVVVFDKLQAPQPLGSGLILQPVGRQVLAKLGVAAEIEDLGAPIAHLFGKAAPRDRVVLDVRYRGSSRARMGLGVHRGALFNALLQAARRSGAAFEAQAEIAETDDRRFVFVDGRRSPGFDLLVDALGVRSPLADGRRRALPYGALWASLDWPASGGFDDRALEQRYVAARKMVGVMPIGRLDSSLQAQAAFFWSLKSDDFPAWRAAPLEAWKAEVLTLWPQTQPLLEKIGSHDDLVYARYAHGASLRPVRGRLASIGDSWHCASPQLGQGANLALLDAWAFAEALRRQPNLEVALNEYVRMRALHLWIYQSVSVLFTPLYQSDANALAAIRDHVAAPLARIWPAPLVLAGLVAGAWGDPLSAIVKGSRHA